MFRSSFRWHNPASTIRVAVLISLFYCSLAVAVDGAAIHRADQNLDGGQWLSYGRGYHEQRFSPLAQVDRSNVGQLKLAWFFDVGNRQGLQATPLVIDGVMYVSAAWNIVHALDASTGEELWRFDPQVPRAENYRYCCGVINRGVAAWDDMIFIGTLDGRLVAIDRATGAERWQTQTTPIGENYTITGAPRVVKGKVIIGNGGAEHGVRGYVSAYDAYTGEMAWRFYTVPGNPADGFENAQMEMAAKTWTGNWWELGGGGTVWDSMAYDPELDLLFIGVGNGSPHNRYIRSPFGGDNLFLCSIIALRPDTGEYVWHYQQIPAETWDYTATQTIILAAINWEGERRKVLMQAPKAGFFYLLDPATGQLLSAEPFAKKITWASHYDMETGRPVEIAGADYADEPVTIFPIGLGAHNWHPMSYSPNTGLVYIPAQHVGGPLEQDHNFKPVERYWNTGINTDYTIHDAQFGQAVMSRLMPGFLLAWDPAQQRAVWEVELPYISNGGTLATAGDLVFQGRNDALFSAHDALSGETLWQFPTQNGIVGSPVSYAVDGKQFVAVPAARGGGLSQIIGLQHNATHHNGRILAFTLDGDASLPEPADAPRNPRPPAMPEVDRETLVEGSSLYGRYCARCHGMGVVSDGSIPDLRHLESFWHDNFSRVVLGGMMVEAGMPNFSDVLDQRQADAIHAYILEQANQDYQLRYERTLWTEVRQFAIDIMAAVIAWLSL